MIERDVAVRMVEEQLARDHDERLAMGLDPLPYAVMDVEEHELVWIVHWQSEEYVRTGNPEFMLAGGGPYLVDRVDGGLRTVGVVSWAGGDWERDYRVRIRGQAVRTAVDDLHDEVRRVAAARGRILAMHTLRAAVPALTHADVVAYVTALQTGHDAPAHLIALATEELVPALDPVLTVRTVRAGNGGGTTIGA